MIITEGKSRMSMDAADAAPAGDVEVNRDAVRAARLAERPRTLVQALADLQGRLPRVAKTETAEVQHKEGGSHEYTYADLADVTNAIMPVMSELGLSFSAFPTLWWDDANHEAAPRFVLQYVLYHSSGEFREGLYPLPSGLGSQMTGSAITYARRYALCAVTGVAPEDDDDAAAAEAGLRRQAREEHAPRQGGKLRSAPRRQEPGQPDADARAAADAQAAHAQSLADIAVAIAEAHGTIAELHDKAYKPAQAKRMLRAEVTDPLTGERTQLTAVITRARARARMESAAGQAAS